MDLQAIKNYSFQKDIICKVIGETVMIYNPQNGDMYELNDTAALLISFFQEGLPGEEILERITSEYDVSPDEVLEDVQPLIMRLIDLGLLKLSLEE